MATVYRDMAKLAEICYDNLQKNTVILEYLKERQITKSTIDKFCLGAFPTDLRVLLKEFVPEFLLKNGIVYDASKTPFYLYPLIIPIRDVNDNFIGIGGRTLLSQEKQKYLGVPKYKNSVYPKMEHMFGLNFAKQAIRKKNAGIVVEGYFDVITSHQAGLCNVVATSGTFLTTHQVMLLSRYCENIKILFDNDAAGKRASKKFLEARATSGVNLREMFLPDGYKDIDEYIVKTSPANVEAL